MTHTQPLPSAGVVPAAGVPVPVVVVSDGVVVVLCVPVVGVAAAGAAEVGDTLVLPEPDLGAAELPDELEWVEQCGAGFGGNGAMVARILAQVLVVAAVFTC